MMENIFLVPDSSEPQRKGGRRKEKAESQAERSFGCHLTGLLNVQVWLPALCTMCPTSLCALLEKQEAHPWRKHSSAPRDQGKVITKVMRETPASG